MASMKVNLKGIADVKDFVTIVNRFDSDFDLSSGRYKVDAKSIMGILSLDLTEPLTLEIHGEGEAAKIKEELAKFAA